MNLDENVLFVASGECIRIETIQAGWSARRTQINNGLLIVAL